MIDDIVFNEILDNPMFSGLREILIDSFSNPTFKDSDEWTDDKFLVNAFGEEYGEELNVDVINMQIETWIENNKTIIQNEFAKIFECSFMFDSIRCWFKSTTKLPKIAMLSFCISFYFGNDSQRAYFHIPLVMLKAGKLPKNVDELNEITKLMEI